MRGELAKTFGGYTLVERLGVGGTASVYLGRKRLHDGFEWVALKRLHPHLLETGEVARMFLHEAELLSRLHHPNVCEILRYGTEDGVPFIATRYLKGASLDGLLKKMSRRQIPVPLMAWIAAEASAGLHHAHEAKNEDGEPLGIVHRDVSPQNIFVTYDGRVQLLDFGIAHAAIAAPQTKAGELKGKDGYMSPEQVGVGVLDRRSDVFSLGIVLWEAITGKRLFQRDNALATVVAITEQPAPDPRTVNSRVTAGLADITRRALSIDPKQRFASAQEMERALRREIGDDLSPQIQLQTLTRNVLGPEQRDSEVDLDVDQLWPVDEDSADLTEIAKPSPLPPPSPAPWSPTPRALRSDLAVTNDLERTLPATRAEPKKEPPPLPPPSLTDDVFETRPPKKKRRAGWVVALALSGAGVALGLAWYWS